MSPTNQDPIARPRADGADDADDADEVEEEVPPWPERGPDIAAAKAADEDDDVRDMTIPPPDPEPIPLPGPDPQPEPIPPPGPDPLPDPTPPPGPDPRPGPVPQPPGPEPVPQPGPDPAPEPGPVNDAEPVPQDVGTDEGSALRHDDDVDDEVDDVEDLELVVHEQPEVAVTTVDDDVDVELEADDRYLDDLEPAPPALAEAVGGPLLPDAGAWEERWTAVQAGFVDDPGASIQQADRLVTEAMEELARILLAQRETLQDQWRTGEAPPDTEQLRLAVQGYRALLFGLLSA